MRRVALVVPLLALACGHGGPAAPPAPQSINQALDQFLAAVKSNDLARMGQLWGTARGPAVTFMKPEELRMRLAVIQKYLSHVGYRVVEGPIVSPANQNIRSYRVELQRQGCNRVQPFDLIRTRDGGWLVYDVHLEASGNPAAPCNPSASPGTGP
jgi:hypothetical protein